MPTITGRLQTILDDEPAAGSVEVALCGFGSQVPRINGMGLGARVTDDSPVVDEDGTFEFQVDGNDKILPAGTYYTVTVKDDNGDIVQVNAYQFLSTQGEYDLDETPPFDPSINPPSLPPLILNLLQIVPYQNDAEYSGAQYIAWQTTMTGDTNAPVFTNLHDGQLYTLILIQDAVGLHAFQWPDNVINAPWINPEPNGMTIQTFVAVAGELLPIGAATFYP